MKWQKVTIHTTVEAEELVSFLLSELGIDGVEIEDQMTVSEEERQSAFSDTSAAEKSAGVSTGETVGATQGESTGESAEVRFYLHEAEGEETAAQGLEVLSGTEDNSYVINDRLWNAEEREELLQTIREKLEELRTFCDIGPGSIELGESRQEEWRDRWKEFYQPILIDRVLFLPSWLEIPEEYSQAVEEGKISAIRIDPGTAFGTGNHETTRLCIKALIHAVKPSDRVLDLGSGSGILAMTAEKSGAGLVTAVDTDPACQRILEENRERNGISPEQFSIIIGNVLSGQETAERILEASGGKPYDIIVANILAPVIMSLSLPGAADRFLKPGGLFIASGILSLKEKEVLDAFAKNPLWEEISIMRDGEWILVTARKSQEFSRL